MTNPHQGWRTFFADTVMFGLIFGLTNIVSYLFIVAAGRTLLPAEFGVFNALLGLLTMAGMFAISLQVAVTRAVTPHANRSVLTGLMRTTWRIALPGIVLLTLMAMPFSSRIGASSTHIALSGIGMLITVLAATAMGFLVGLGKIRSQALVNLLGAIVRLGVGWPLMLVGLGVSGALSGYAINYVVVLVLAYAMSLGAVDDRSAEAAASIPALRLDGSAIATFVLAFAPFCLDQFMVQAAAPSLGGDYAALATMAKVVFYGTYPIIAVAYPNMLGRTDRRSQARILVAAALGVICVATILAWALGAFPLHSTRFFFGDRFEGSAPYLGSLAFGVVCFSLSALGAHALIAWDNWMGFLPSLVALGAAVGLFAFRHDSLAAVVENQIWVYALQLILVLTLCGATFMRTRERSDVRAAGRATRS